MLGPGFGGASGSAPEVPSWTHRQIERDAVAILLLPSHVDRICPAVRHGASRQLCFVRQDHIVSATKSSRGAIVPAWAAAVETLLTETAFTDIRLASPYAWSRSCANCPASGWRP